MTPEVSDDEVERALDVYLASDVDDMRTDMRRVLTDFASRRASSVPPLSPTPTQDMSAVRAEEVSRFLDCRFGVTWTHAFSGGWKVATDPGALFPNVAAAVRQAMRLEQSRVPAAAREPRPKPAASEHQPRCPDCGVVLDPGTAKVFTVCDTCWAKHYPSRYPAPAALSPADEPPTREEGR